MLTSLTTRRSRRSPGRCRGRSRPGPARGSPARGRPAGTRPARRGLLGREVGGHVEVDGVVEVLGVEVVPVDAGPEPDLRGQAGLGQPPPSPRQHAALDLAAGHGRLDHDLGVDRGGGGHGGVEVRPSR